MSDLWDDLGLWPNRRFDRCILHIGTEKTGTTSLQQYLGANRAALLKAGVFVPASLSPYPVMANHERLTTYALDDAKLADDLRVAAGIRSAEDVGIHRANILRDIIREMMALPARSKPILLLSNEHCHSRLVELAEVARLGSLLFRLARHVTIVVYLRPQHDLAVSLYDQALKSGHHDIPILPEFDRPGRRWVARGFFDYEALLNRWAQVFGHDNIEPRIFDRGSLIGGSIVDDVVSRLSPKLPRPAPTADRNASMNAERQQVLNVVNRVAHRRGTPLPPALRASLIAELQKGSSGAGRQPARSAAIRFYDSFALVNERVRASWLPRHDVLFRPDFDRYPQDTAAEPPETAALAAILLGQQQTILDLRTASGRAQAATPA